MDLIPAVDVLDGRVVRLRQGRRDAVTVYGEDPAARLREWWDQGASLVHVVDLTGAFGGTWDPDLWHMLGQTGLPFQAGGGIRSVEAAQATIAAGARRVVVGSTAVWDPELLISILDTVGPEGVVAAVDVRDERALGSGWVDEGRPLAEVFDNLSDAGVVRALVTGISTDGALSGPAIELFRRCAELAPEIALIASGGVGSLEDLRLLRTLPLDGVIVGRALYEDAFTVREAVEALADEIV